MRLIRIAATVSLALTATFMAVTPTTAAPQNGTAVSLAEAVKLRGSDAVGTLACSNVYLTNNANGGIVSAELGYGGGDYGMLRARATAVGSWEVFELCIGSSYDTLRSTANGLYVSAELGYGGGDYAMLRARATAIGPWEQFIVGCPSNCYIYSLANGGYTSAELGYGGGDYAMLRARSASWGPWEMFS